MPLLSASLVFLAALQNQPAQSQPTTARISGRVLEEGSGRPISAARVILLPRGRPSTFGPPSQVSTDREGRFVFELVAPGSYVLDVQRGGYVPVSSDPSRREARNVVAGQDLVWPDVTLQKGGVIAGRILDESGEPMPDVRVTALKSFERPGGIPESIGASVSPRVPVGQGAQTNDLGEFRLFSLPPGEYVVLASLMQRLSAGAGTTLAATYFPGTTDVSSAQSVSVAPGHDANGVEFRMMSTPAFTVSGTVVDEAGAVVGGAMVMLMPGAPMMGGVGPPSQSSSDAQGHFVIGGVAPGSYRLTAIIPVRLNGQGADGFAFSSNLSLSSSTQGPQNVVVRDANVTDVRLVIRRSR